MSGYWYLGTPYSKYPPELGGVAGAYHRACELAGMLVRQGFHVYCPIAHTHPIAIKGKLDPFDHELWMPLDECFMKNAKGLIIGTMRGWRDSYGLEVERRYFESVNKPVRFLMDSDDFLFIEECEA